MLGDGPKRAIGVEDPELVSRCQSEDKDRHLSPRDSIRAPSGELERWIGGGTVPSGGRKVHSDDLLDEPGFGGPVSSCQGRNQAASSAVGASPSRARALAARSASRRATIAARTGGSTESRRTIRCPPQRRKAPARPPATRPGCLARESRTACGIACSPRRPRPMLLSLLGRSWTYVPLDLAIRVFR